MISILYYSHKNNSTDNIDHSSLLIYMQQYSKQSEALIKDPKTYIGVDHVTLSSLDSNIHQAKMLHILEYQCSCKIHQH